MHLVKVIIIFFIGGLVYMNSYAQNYEWQTNGPSATRVTEIANQPGNNQSLFIGTVEDGIYNSLDYGDSWSRLEAVNLPTNIRIIKFNPDYPDTIYVTTTEGAYRSSDNGHTYSRVILPNNWDGEVNGIEIMPSHPNVLFCGGFTLNYKSSNSGRDWERIADLDFLYAQRFMADPIDSNIVYCLTQSGYFSKTLFKSDDLGDSWTCIHNDMDTTLVAYDFDIDPIDNRNIYISGGDPENINASSLVRTENGGTNWSDITPPNLAVKLMECVAVSPTEHNTIYVGSVANGLFMSSDRGETWQNLDVGSRNAHIYKIFIDPVTGAIFVSVFFDGLYKSADGGLNWRKISSAINTADCRGISIFPGNSNKLIVPTEKKVFLSNDSGVSWNELIIDLPVISYNFSTNIVVDPLRPDDIYGGYADFWDCSPNGIYKSNDGGANWTFSNADFSRSSFPIGIAISNFDNDRKRLFLISTHGAYYSDDSGDNWSLFENGLPSYSYYRNISVSDLNPNLIFVGTREGDLYRSTDGGESWDELDHNLPGLYFNQVLCDPIDQSIVYVSKEFAGLYKSMDAGSTWVNITNNIDLIPDCITLSGLVINPLNNLNMLVVSYKRGVFISYDGGSYWSGYSNGLNTNFNFGYTIFDPLDTNKIYLASSSRSVWSITRTPTGIEDDRQPLPSQVSLSAYPNPFNAAANISFSLPEASNVTLDIYDLLGRRTASLLDSYLPAGNHSLLWHPEDLAAGVYIYRLTTDNNQTSHKITLLK